MKRLLVFVVTFWLALALGIWAWRQGRRAMADPADDWMFV